MMGDRLLQRITVEPDICHGKPCIRNMRYPVSMILDLLGSAMSIDEILADYKDLEAEDILACLRYASRLAHTKTVLGLAS